MVDVKKVFTEYSKLNCLDLLTELPGCSFNCKLNDVYYFEVSEPETIVELLTVCLGEYTYGNNLTYKYKDGTSARFVKSRGWYEFKKCKKVIARVKVV